MAVANQDGHPNHKPLPHPSYILVVIGPSSFSIFFLTVVLKSEHTKRDTNVSLFLWQSSFEPFCFGDLFMLNQFSCRTQKGGINSSHMFIAIDVGADLQLYKLSLSAETNGPR